MKKTAKILRLISLWGMLLFSVMLFLFALFSGAEVGEKGLPGLISNSPNALPGLVLLLLVYTAWKYSIIGSLLFVIAGLAMMFFFGIFSPDTPVSLVIITLIPVFFGLLLLLSQLMLSRKQS